MTPNQKIAGAVAAVVVLVIGLTAISLTIPEPDSEAMFSCAGVSTSSNGSVISIVVRNPSSAGISYYIGNAEFKSNGFWKEFRFTPGLTSAPGVIRYAPGVRLQLLPAGQSVTNVVSVSATNGEARVPVLWGFVSTVKANRLQQMWEDMAVNIRMHNSRGRGTLYTNFVSDIKW